ncbi:TonB-dependent siderophore receptor [Chitinibacter sp. S2-10]|uniref:TonB-dependent siderophore receptor n=1 Tax=Chitinibacter sp. S2-10 TaxID=3373597 RepID=UPI0039778FD7
MHFQPHPAANAMPLKRIRLKPLAALLAALSFTPLVHAADEVTLAEVSVTADSTATPSTEATGLYTTTKSKSANKLDLSLRETPQTVSVISRSQIEDFGLNSVNDVLSYSAGVTVERIETDRTYYTSRGFDVTNFQIDGIGVPFSDDLVNGDIDTVIYDRVDVVYGANGLMTGTGMPSAAVNFVRKRPTDTFAANASISAGSWQNYRAEADISAPLSESGRVRARLIAALETKESYLDRYGRDKGVISGIIEADLTDTTLLSVGYTQQETRVDSPMWGALPLINTDGTPTNYPRSTSTAADWAYMDSGSKTAFAEITQKLAQDWSAKLVYTHNEFDSESELFYVYGTPDAQTGLGLYSYPSAYTMKTKQDIADLAFSGQVEVAGRKHDISVGGNLSQSKKAEWSGYGQGIGTALPPLLGWDGHYTKPTFDARFDTSDFKDKRQSVYLASRLNLADPLKVIVGARWTNVDITGVSYGTSRATSASDTTPYVGVTYDLNSNFSVYASHTRIFDPQHETNVSGDVLAPVEGKSSEAGVKAAFFNNTLNASLAYFATEQRNLAEQAGYDANFKAYYTGIDAESRGVQFDVSGQITSDWQANLGYTHLSLENPAGEDVRTYLPRNLLRLSTTYRLPFAPAIKVGGNVSWQDAIHAKAGAGTIEQGSYALLSLMARYDINEDFSATLNINNVTDEKYISSLYWGSYGQGFYGAPRSFSASVNWKY